MVIFIPREETEWYRPYLFQFATIYVLFVLGIGIYVFTRQALTQREHWAANLTYLSFLLPIVTLQCRNLSFIKGNVILPCILVGSCIIIYYLLKTDQLTDTTAYMQENLYDTSEIATVLFDRRFYYLSANHVAKELFEGEMVRKRKRKSEHLYREKIKYLQQQPEQMQEVVFGGKDYRCQLKTVYKRGKCSGYILSAVDISKQKQELRELERLKQFAEEQNVMRGKFLASISHDLRSPLHAIIGLSDSLIVKKDLAARTRAAVMQIKDSSRMLLQLVNDILEYSKLGVGKLEFSHQPYSLERLLKEIAQMCIINLKDKPVDFRVHFPNGYPKMLMGDELRVREIFQNLLSNAVKYTHEGEIFCELSCRKEGEECVCLECRISDTGIGMSKEQLEKVFLEYETFASEQGGIGLGLNIVWQLVMQLGGTVRAESDGVSGSTFYVTFYQDLAGDEWKPEQQFTKEMLLTSENGLLRPTRPSYVYPTARVLLADDLKVNREIFEELLAQWQLQVDTVEGGAEALEQVQRENYHLIFLDQMMPGMTGIETARRLKEAGNQVPLVLLTADLSDRTRQESQAAGLNAFLGKPISLNKLNQLLEQYLPMSCRQRVENTLSTDRREQKLYRRMMESVCKELEELVEKLPEYATEDIDLFRIKVHGIKGFCNQISREALAKTAEIMEMAAKTENHRFIENWLPDFLAEIRETVEEISLELMLLPKEEEQAEAFAASKEELFAQLKEAFDSYQLEQAQQAIAALSALPEAALVSEERERLEKARDACEEMDYELGSSLF
ncbi:MAG: response regulator [Lachnospiraceae bacterium]|nr:response regulator [Lachnospiraceae bacterium]